MVLPEFDEINAIGGQETEVACLLQAGKTEADTNRMNNSTMEPQVQDYLKQFKAQAVMD